MRFKLTLKKLDNKAILPINYQYPLSVWIYRMIQNAESSYSLFLSKKGVNTLRKSFKYFSFSDLFLSKYELLTNEEGIKDRISIQSPNITLQISFYLDKICESFIKDLFANKLLILGDQKTQARFEVAYVDALPLQIESETVKLKTLSPVVLKRKKEDGTMGYISPKHEEFEQYFLDNLIGKLTTVAETFPNGLMGMQQIEPKFKLLTSSSIKSRIITIKADTPDQVELKGFHPFEFELTAPKEMIELGLLMGFGKYNEEGMGYCEILKSEKLKIKS